VESSPSAAADARINLANHRSTKVLNHRSTKVLNHKVEVWRPTPADVVIADPARAGLGAPGVKAVAATGAPIVVLVSCDAASLGRDVGLLAKAGYSFQRSTLVDLFAHTSHVECVSVFRKS
jgi:23S rRNA (uracil1939-C5)-methyltransferase